MGLVCHHRTALTADVPGTVITPAGWAAKAATVSPPSSFSANEKDKILNLLNVNDIDLTLWAARASGSAEGDTFTVTVLGRRGNSHPIKLFEAACTCGSFGLANVNPITNEAVASRTFRAVDTIVPTSAYDEAGAGLSDYVLYNATGTPGNEIAHVVIATQQCDELFVCISDFDSDLERVDVQIGAIE